jgi:hypothetical protein
VVVEVEAEKAVDTLVEVEDEDDPRTITVREVLPRNNWR